MILNILADSAPLIYSKVLATRNLERSTHLAAVIRQEMGMFAKTHIAKPFPKQMVE